MKPVLTAPIHQQKKTPLQVLQIFYIVMTQALVIKNDDVCALVRENN